jgi:hypothetical protein
MGDTSTELTLNSTLITTLTSTLRTTSTIDLAPVNGSIFRLISNLFNVSELYKHQVADLLEPEKVSIRHIHFIIWSFSILTYLVAIPVGVRLIKTKAYLNVIEYFSFHIVLCAFLAWIPNLIFILHFWFQSVSIRVCRLHYTILSTNETVSCRQQNKLNIRFLCYFLGSVFLHTLYDYRTFSLCSSIR